MNKSPKVFISYSHQIGKYEDRILEFTNRLRTNGIDANIDLFVESPVEGWPRWMENQIRQSDFILIMNDKSYYEKCYDNKSKGVSWEVNIVYQHIYDFKSENTKFIPIISCRKDEQYILTPLKPFTFYNIELDEGYNKLCNRLRDIIETVKLPLGKLIPLSTKEKRAMFFYSPNELNVTTSTRNALERIFNDEEIAEFLSTEQNFQLVSSGIKEQLKVLTEKEGNEQLFVAYKNNDNEYLLKTFCKLMVDRGVNSYNSELEEKWFKDELFPSKEYSIKMCFAFRLSDISKPITAGEFLFNVCRVNGFNYRIAEDIIYYYALVNNEDYRYAQTLIREYKSRTLNVALKDGSETKSTKQIKDVFEDIEIMSEIDFMDTLVANANNFIGYNKTSHNEFVILYSELNKLIISDISEGNISTYDKKIKEYATCSDKTFEIYDEIIFDGFIRALTANKKGVAKIDIRNTLIDILGNFSIKKSKCYMRSIKIVSQDKTTYFIHNCYYSRMMFVMCFFSKYILGWKKVWDNPESKIPNSFFLNFQHLLIKKLGRCSFSQLYPANPFDWIILKCVKMLFESAQVDDKYIIELFTGMIKLFTEHRCTE